MRKTILILAVLFFMVGTISAQFQEGKHHAGPSIGLSFLGSTLSFGANYEYGMKIDDVPGLIGVGGIFRYWSFGDAFSSSDYTISYMIFGAQGNYHFKVGNGKIDPYIGLTLGYQSISGGWLGYGAGGIYFGFQGGARYWFSPNMAAHARFGAGAGSSLDLGIDFKF